MREKRKVTDLAERDELRGLLGGWLLWFYDDDERSKPRLTELTKSAIEPLPFPRGHPQEGRRHEHAGRRADRRG